MNWKTYITKIEPNEITIAGYKLSEIVKKRDFLDTSYLLIRRKFPSRKEKKELVEILQNAICSPPPHIEKRKNEQLSKTIIRYILSDKILDKNYSNEKKAVFFIGRMLTYIADIFSTTDSLLMKTDLSFSSLLFRAIGGKDINKKYGRMLEAIMVASVDHGVTPPSAQATIIAASTRASYDVAIADGISTITDVHGGAGMMAALFFRECIELSKKEDITLEEAVKRSIKRYMEDGRKIKGLGHRIHKNDPRKRALLEIAKIYEINGPGIKIAEIIEKVFREIKGKFLPLNVDGTIGAIITDMNLDPSIAKLLFIYGRIAGLSAHYFEEIETQPPMRHINFDEAVYVESGKRDI